MSRLRAAGVVLVAVLALVAPDGGRHSISAVGVSASPARVTTGGSGSAEVVVPTRVFAATAGWVEGGSPKPRPFPHSAVILAAAALLAALVAGLARRRPGPPWHHRRRHSAALRAPPLPLHA